jgi:hypothetical protein
MWKVNNTEPVEHIECSLTKVPDVYLDLIPKRKIELLMEEYPHQEWFAYLVGKTTDRGNISVGDISVPPHKEASTASAEIEPFHTPGNCVGVIHSHHSMGAFHSGTDDSYVDRNYPISITVAKKTQALEFDAISYNTTPCGKPMLTKISVKYISPKPLFDEKAFITESRANIDKSKDHMRMVSTGLSMIPQQEFYDQLVQKKHDKPKFQMGVTHYIDKHGAIVTKEEFKADIQDKD